MVLIYLNIIAFLSLLFFALGKYIIHVVPHSHDDPGWIKSFDEYYQQSIISILSNTIESLIKNPQRKFVFSEISFFKPWYMNQTKETRDKVKALVKEKQFEFVNGGYVMEDEAACHYQDAINQLRLGLDFLSTEFNVTPTIGWFLDSFGHSASHAYIYKQFNYDTIVFGRTDEKYKKAKKKTGDLELNWRPLNTKDSLLVHMVSEYYCPPAPIRKYVDDRLLNLTDAKLSEIVKKYTKYLDNDVLGFKHHHSLLFYGCDFTFNAKDKNYLNIEALMDYIERTKNSGIELKYSTVEEYFIEVRKELENKTLAEHEGDFFPYSDPGMDVWTGFFTSRAYLKGAIREHSILHSLSSYFILDYFTKTGKYSNEIYEQQTSLQVALAINQHHDAIAGTAKTYVSNDYIDMMNNGVNDIRKAYRKIMEDMLHIVNITFCLGNGKSKLSCNEAFITDDLLQETKTIGLINPGLEGKTLITFEYSAFSSVSSKVLSFVNSLSLYDLKDTLIPKDDICIPNKKCYSFFFVNLTKNILIMPIRVKVSNSNSNSNGVNQNVNMTFESIKEEKITLMEKTVYIKKVTYNKALNQFDVHLYQSTDSKYKVSFTHGNYTGHSNEGAYIFKPRSSLFTAEIDYSNSFIITSNLSINVLLRLTNSYLLITLFKDPFFIHLTSILDAFDSHSSVGYDYVLIASATHSIDNIIRKHPLLQPSTEFWTDSNGMRLVKRSNSSHLLQENFYPINTEISIWDQLKSERQMSIFTDRPQGGTSIKQGEIMLMINRYSKKDDNKGLFEKLFEPQSANGLFTIKHIVSFNSKVIQEMARNYFVKTPLFYKGDCNRNLLALTITKSELSNMFIVPSNIHMEVLFLSNKAIIVQFFNSHDNYYHYFDKINYYRSIISINRRDNIQIEECSVNGINCNKTNHNSETLSYRIEPLQFKVFKLFIK